MAGQVEETRWRWTSSSICSNLTIAKLKILLLLVFLVLLVLYRAHRTTLQRLFLYLTIATALDAMVTILDIELQFDIDPRLCGWIGFGDVWMGNLVELFNTAIVVHLSTTAYQRLKGREVRCLSSCRRHPVLIETVCVAAIVLFPLSYLWVPIVHQTRGLGETVCWIKKLDETCHTVYYFMVDAIILEVFGILLHLIVIISFLTLIVILTIHVMKLQHSGEEKLEKAFLLITLLGLSLCIRVAQFGMNTSIDFLGMKVNKYLYSAINNSAITASYLISFGFAVYLQSPRSLEHHRKSGWISNAITAIQSKTRKQTRQFIDHLFHTDS